MQMADLSKLNYRTELVPLAKKLGIARPNSKTRYELTSLILAAEGVSSFPPDAASQAPFDPHEADHAGPAQPGMMDGPEVRQTLPSTADEDRKESPPAALSGPTALQIIVYEDFDKAVLFCPVRHKDIAEMPLDGLRGVGRQPKIRKLREIAEQLGMHVSSIVNQ
jgi:hypothetical protein